MRWMYPILILLMFLLGGCDYVDDHRTTIRLASTDLTAHMEGVEATAASTTGYSIDQTISIRLYDEEGTVLSTQEDQVCWTISPALDYLQIRTQAPSMAYRYEIIRHENDGFHRYFLEQGGVEEEAIAIATFDELLERFHDHIALDLGGLRITSFETEDDRTYSFHVDIADVILEHNLRTYLDEVGLSAAYEESVAMTLTFHEALDGFTIDINLIDIPMDGQAITADIHVTIDMTYHDVTPLDPADR